MRVLLVSPYDFATPGGVTEHVAQLASSLLQLGHGATVLAPTSRVGPAAQKLDFIPAGRVTRVPTNGSVARITLSLGLARTVRRVIEERRPDLIHVHEPFMPLLPYVALRHSTMPNIATFHANPGNESGYRHGRVLLDYYFAKLDGQIAVSEAARSFVARYFDVPISVIPNGVNLERFRDALPIPSLCDGRTNVLFVGRLDERKGFGVLLSAYARLRKRHSAVRLLVVGAYDTSQQAHYRRICLRQGIADVEFAGYVAPSDLARYYASSDIVCAPSLGSESFGIVLLEAMAAGKPIVASRISGYRDVVDDGVQGILVPPADADALSDALESLVCDRGRCVQFGKQGASKAATYAWPLIADRVVQYYRSVLENKEARRCLARSNSQRDASPRQLLDS